MSIPTAARAVHVKAGYIEKFNINQMGLVPLTTGVTVSNITRQRQGNVGLTLPVVLAGVIAADFGMMIGLVEAFQIAKLKQ
jgi:hypothetical protein